MNIGPFLNMQAEAGNPDGNSVKRTFWTGTRNLDVDRGAFVFETVLGAQTPSGKDNQYLFAVAVRPGDVLAVPERSTLALVLAGLGEVVGFSRARAGVVDKC